MQAFRFTYLNQLARLAGGPVILILLPFFLSVEQQGYWFTMISFTAFVAFADMGLSSALIQSAAHEQAMVEQSISQCSKEVARYRVRLETLRIFAWRRSIWVALWVLPFVVVIGLYMLSDQSAQMLIRWEGPWILLCLASVASLVLTINLAFYEGCNDVAGIQRVRAIIAFSNVILLALSLIFGLGLWSLPLSTGASTALGFWLIWRHTRPKHTYALTISSSEVNAAIKDWSNEISPLLSKYAGSWIGGYAMFQLFTPIVFRLEGAAAAGKVGLTISVFAAIFTLSNVWSSYQLPRFSMAIAVRDRNALDRCIYIALKGSLLTYSVLASIAIAAYLVLHHCTHLQDRFLGIEAIGSLTIVWLLQLLVHNLAVYLRAFKEEPLVWYTMFAAVHSIVATLVTLQFFGLKYLFVGFLTVYIWFTPAVLLLFMRKRESTKFWPELSRQISKEE